MAKSISIKGEKNLTDAFGVFLKDLLGSGSVDALLVPQEIASGGSVVPTLVKDANNLHPDPYAMALPVNAAPLLVRTTDDSDVGDTIGAVLKPCEIRAAIELIKLNQINRDRVVLIGRDCLGTFSVEDYSAVTEAEGAGWTEKAFKDIQNSAEFAYGGKQMRSACRVCKTLAPYSADLVVRTIGVGDEKEIIVEAKTQRGEEILEKMNGQEKEYPDNPALEKLSAAKEANRETLVKEAKEAVSTKEGLQKVFSTCIRCLNCMRACPICYCHECFFESDITALSPGQYLEKAGKEGTLRMPTDVLLFQLGRMNHMITSCVACGLCESACPSSIPLLSLYDALGKDVQDIFEYVPGRDEEEDLPVAVYKSDELEPR
jgi:formate dehydrogenase subunit beta